MKNKFHLPDVGMSFFFLTITLALTSWIASIYGSGEVQNLLSAEGIRWMLGHMVENYITTPSLSVMIFLFMGTGVWVRSGLYDASVRLFHKGKLLSHKERRAMIWAFSAWIIYGLTILATTLIPVNILQSVIGEWANSPFSKGFIFLFSLGIGLAGIIYGYTSDRFRRMKDTFDAMSYHIAHYASYWVGLFFVVQFFSSLEYTHMDNWLNIPESVVNVFFHFFSYVPLLTIFIQRNLTK